jgi:extracellular elastinolytic metalloproteinase
VSGKIKFAGAAPEDDDQKVVNIFYFCNYMHDFLYLLGFDEQAGNFQVRNPGDTGSQGDSVVAKSWPNPIFGTANMSTPRDGSPPQMNMGLVASTNRHTALDADVVFHEYVHGLTNRLVGGRLDDDSLDMPQSGGMGEGWSDYFALTIQNYGKDEERVVTGDWVKNDPKGIRLFKYDESFPDNFGHIGTGRYHLGPDGNPRVHNIGEIWCATLMKMNRELGAALNSPERGHVLGWQIVVDGLKLTAANPSFLDARDAILRAMDDLHTTGRLKDEEHVKALKATWDSFAKFGMGANARSQGAVFQGIVADFSAPPNR